MPQEPKPVTRQRLPQRLGERNEPGTQTLVQFDDDPYYRGSMDFRPIPLPPGESVEIPKELDPERIERLNQAL